MKVAKLQILKPNNYVEHPVFMKLKLKLTIKFLETHTRHYIDMVKPNNWVKHKRATMHLQSQALAPAGH